MTNETNDETETETTWTERQRQNITENIQIHQLFLHQSVKAKPPLNWMLDRNHCSCQTNLFGFICSYRKPRQPMTAVPSASAVR